MPFLYISLCDCFVMCKDLVVYCVHILGLIDSDKISYIVLVPSNKVATKLISDHSYHDIKDQNCCFTIMQ